MARFGVSEWTEADLEPLVLKDSLDRRVFAIWRELGLEHDSKRSVSYDLALCILHLFCLACNPILYLFPNDFCRRLIQQLS